MARPILVDGPRGAYVSHISVPGPLLWRPILVPTKKGRRRLRDTAPCLLSCSGLAEEHLVGVRQVELSAAEAGVAVPVLVVERGTGGDLTSA